MHRSQIPCANITISSHSKRMQAILFVLVSYRRSLPQKCIISNTFQCIIPCPKNLRKMFLHPTSRRLAPNASGSYMALWEFSVSRAEGSTPNPGSTTFSSEGLPGAIHHVDFSQAIKCREVESHIWAEASGFIRFPYPPYFICEVYCQLMCLCKLIHCHHHTRPD